MVYRQVRSFSVLEPNSAGQQLSRTQLAYPWPKWYLYVNESASLLLLQQGEKTLNGLSIPTP